ncbi:MAG: multiheme c-type cytochrome [Phycisphaerae bacterium]
MKSGLMIVLASVACGVGVSVWQTTSRAADDPAVVPAVVATSAAVGTAEDKSTYTYVGSKKCKKCHIAVYKSWSKTLMGQAFEALKPGNAKENKEKFKIDLTKDFSRDEKCVKCHTVGFGKPGGYKIPDLSDKKAVRKSKAFQGIGCEMCHGPGSEYVKVFKEILKSKRTYTDEELYAVGLKKIDADTCKQCHNEESPTINPGDPFDFEEKKKKGIHDHQKLKQRQT